MYLALGCTIALLVAGGTRASAKPKFTDMLPPPSLYGYSLIDGPHTWGREFDSCDSGQQQSPVQLTRVGSIRAKLPSLEWLGHWDVREDGFTLTNTWHSAEVQYSGDEPVILGGPLSDEYVLSQVHFHWGDDVGSEHSIDGEFFDMEAHLVHYKSEYDTVTNASEHLDGLAVIGLFFRGSDKNNTDLDGIVSALSDIQDGGSSTSLPDDAMTWILEHVVTEKYYTYQGSLTTPPCSEIVTWVVMDHVENIGVKQIAEFQKLRGEEGEMSTNVRPSQPLNGRQVFFCSAASSLSSLDHVSLLGIILLLNVMCVKYHS